MFFGDLEKRIMDMLWRNSEPVSVRCVKEYLNAHSKKQYAYTTIMTTLSRLHVKEVVSRKQSGRSFLYFAKQTKADFFRDLSKDVLRMLSKDYGDVAVAYFVEASQEVDIKHLEDWKKQLKE